MDYLYFTFSQIISCRSCAHLVLHFLVWLEKLSLVHSVLDFRRHAIPLSHQVNCCCECQSHTVCSCGHRNSDQLVDSQSAFHTDVSQILSSKWTSCHSFMYPFCSFNMQLRCIFVSIHLLSDSTPLPHKYNVLSKRSSPHLLSIRYSALIPSCLPHWSA